MQTQILRRILIIGLLLGVLTGCASYQGAQAKPAEYYQDGKPVPGDYRVESVFKF